MKLSFMLSKECVVPCIKGGKREKSEVLSELLSVLKENSSLCNECFSTDDLLEALLVREKELSTGVGNGFAFPHIRMKGIKGAYILFATCPEGLEYDCPDGKPVNFIFLTVISEENANLLLQTRAALTRMLLPREAQENVLKLDDAEKIWKYIDKSGTSIGKDIDARDIMAPQIGVIKTEMTLSQAATALHKYHSDTLPVTDEDGNMIGVLSGHDIFRYTMPEFFFFMKTLSFMKHMDPFEQAIANGREKKVKDILSDLREYSQVSPDSTLLELIFEFCAHNAASIYVVENGKLAGVINRFALVDKIITEKEGLPE